MVLERKEVVMPDLGGLLFVALFFTGVPGQTEFQLSGYRVMSYEATKTDCETFARRQAQLSFAKYLIRVRWRCERLGEVSFSQLLQQHDI